MSKEQLTFYGKTDMGRQRTNNEDAFVLEQIDQYTLLTIAIDGVGGYEGGEVAAEIAQKEIPAYLKNFSHGERLELLKQAVVSANNAIYERRQLDTARSNMSCVLTSALIDTERKVLDMVHVGDTRLYQFHHGELVKLSHDHSLIGYREEIGDLTEEEAMHHPQRNVISRDVGSERHEVEDPDFLEAEEFPLLPNTTFLLCSDGLTDLITSRQIVEILERQVTLETKAQQLIEAANEAGGKDNVTVVLAEYQAEEVVKSIVEDDNLPIESKHETTDNDAEELMKNNLNNKLSKWKYFLQKRRKILSIVVIVLSLLLICLLLLYENITHNIWEESHYSYYDLKENDVRLKILGTFNYVLFWTVGILSLCLVLQELFSIAKSKSYLITYAIYLYVIIGVLFSLSFLIEGENMDWVLISIIIVGGFCLYETLLYVIRPVIKLFKSDFNWKQKFKTIISASFYALAYIWGLFYSLVILSGTIEDIMKRFFGHLGEGDAICYERLYDPERYIPAILFPFFIVLSTFGMNIIHDVIEKKIKEKATETDEILKTQRMNKKADLSIEINKTNNGCLVFIIVTLLIIALQIVFIGVWANSKPSNKKPKVEEVAIVEEETDEEFDKMICTLDSLGARQEYIDSVSVSSEEIDNFFSDIK